MKTGLILCFFSLSLFAQSSLLLQRPVVDERVELISIVFRMAGAEEYSSEAFKEYSNRIYDHFMPYKDHEIMAFVDRQRQTTGTGYDAVMEMAIHIGPAPDFKPLFPFTDAAPARWGKKPAEAFLVLLRQFYKDADCETFFQLNRELYRQSEALFMPLYDKLDLNWYRDFYGKEPKEQFNIILGLGNGGGNYGPAIAYPDGRREVFAIMGATAVGDGKLPHFDEDVFPTLLHEFNHSFVNYFTPLHHSPLKGSGKLIFRHMQDQMKKQAYSGWETMLNEALVRAAVIRYMKDHDYPQQQVSAELLQQLNRGFIWIEELGLKLENYSANRHKYPTLESYMPELISFYSGLASRFEDVKKSFDSKKPKVVNIAEFKNGSRSVNPGIKSITIHFDRPLEAKGYSIHLGSKGKDTYPPMSEKPVYNDDKTSLTVFVELEPEREYELVLSGRRFRSVEGIGMDDYAIYFNTAGR